MTAKIKNQNTDFVRLKSTPRMWIVFFLFLFLVSAITIFCLDKLVNMMQEDALATRVFTVENDSVSIKLPDDWDIVDTSDGNHITFQSADGYESLSIVSMDATNVTAASITFMLELQGMFPDVDADILDYSEMTLGGKKAYITQVQYASKYYLCGVMESGNTIIKAVYSASVMTGEVSDIDTIIASINYRKK